MVRNLMMIFGLTLAVAAFGCDSDSGNPAGSGGSGGSGGGGGEGGAAGEGGSAGEGGAGGAPGAGACLDAADMALVCDEPSFSMDLATCAAGASGSGPATSTCLQTTPGLSEACADCYGADITCLVANCIVECAADPGSQACSDCRELNCSVALGNCSGVVCE